MNESYTCPRCHATITAADAWWDELRVSGQCPSCAHKHRLRRRWRTMLAIGTIALLYLPVYYRLRSSFSCEGISKLRLGMTQDEVRSVLGEPASTAATPENSDPIQFDSAWDYQHNPSRYWLGVNFYRGHLVLADAGIRHFLGDDETVFVLSERERRTSPRFRAAYCR